ncbi:xanthine and CO dehydrogenases maturation factor, XdhC/CoxF family [Belliella baltica DSM 15883]|uniref:Xanthine and CO dehydrogenases maturation factor, XdhC/CoxF family n=1 Tax=Belliella baltica (strain DSM 15883 / CIP 108006 / LMG 21964 / BA134) TaxID=866536 RepID=I3Z7V9_BELBD|nr:XdhC/CoxI family protein [Belliella baltica]AFL85327.1 xanthine and CO dehydrogenases maturation factor, XdhC/CoxF family [Belliella baltica DSM 15883]
MKEFQLILEAYKIYEKTNIKSALATVVKVDGSAYRRPGARMLVSENGDLTGAISGGCLEGDALRKAQSVIFQNQSMLVTYDTTDEDDQKFGIGLGCNGIIQILMEPIDYQNKSNPILLLEKAFEERLDSTLISIFSIKNSRSAQIGTIGLRKGEELFGDFNQLDDSIKTRVLSDLNHSVDQIDSAVHIYKAFDDLHVFFEVIKPPIRICLFGAGNDTIPLCKMASFLGWEVVLIDGRKQYATKERFEHASAIVVGPADEVVSQLEFDQNTVALLMTHNFEYEVKVLEQLLPFSLPYIGILGPKKKSLKLFERLENQGVNVNQEHIYGPVGLNIGAEGAEEIALSILAEIKTVLMQKEPYSLRDKKGSIHD